MLGVLFWRRRLGTWWVSRVFTPSRVHDLTPRPALRGNREAYDRVFIRPRVLRDVKEVDTSTKILGMDSPAPFYISPTARNGWSNPIVSAIPSTLACAA